MKTGEIRNAFLKYFETKGHHLVDSSPLIPKDDPTLLFTNAGMVQFKDYFLGQKKPPYKRAASSQRCVRAGGKHNDLDNVGFTARHHTFFEMLGNFSFGDYFKEEAIDYSWELLTTVFKIPEAKLWVTVLEGDDESANIWIKKIGVPKERVIYCGKDDNFWMMGDTGPCGPCSEIFFDHGPKVEGGPPGSENADGDRFVEIWNLVFMQYERSVDGVMTEIPRPCVDTGMGLERIAAVLQGVSNNYEIDLFQNLISRCRQIFPEAMASDGSLKVIADHIRSCAFLIADGVSPSNEGRGYVLRRIIRRAIRHGHKLGKKEVFFHRLIDPLVTEMGEAYSVLSEQSDLLSETLRDEEERFLDTLDNGMKILLEHIDKSKNKDIDGELAFQLYDTYGFPVDLTADVAKEYDAVVDMSGFDAAMQRQRNLGRQSHQFARSDSKIDVVINSIKEYSYDTSFVGYDSLRTDSTVKKIFVDGVEKEILSQDDEAILVLDRTPFYAEAGGQVGDIGRIKGGEGLFEVLDTQVGQGCYLHIGKQISGSMQSGQTIRAEVDAKTRESTRSNHSATHLVHAALRSILGNHVEQKGSYVDSSKLRFDFSHKKALSVSELSEVERLVNSQIRANYPIETEIKDYQKALEDGAVAFFEEKYSDEVRVLTMGPFSSELCGGTHALRTGDLGIFKITSQTSVGSGLRRIEAVCGENAEIFISDNQRKLSSISELVKSSTDRLEEKIIDLVKIKGKLEKDIATLKKKLAGDGQDDLSNAIEMLGEVKVVSKFLQDSSMDILRDSCDRLKDKHSNIIVVLGTVEEDKVRLVAGVTRDLSKEISAVELINFVADQVGGKGGGRPDMAQAGGSKPEGLEPALGTVKEWVKSKLCDAK